MTSPDETTGNEKDLETQGAGLESGDQSGLAGSTSQEDDETDQALSEGEDETVDETEEPDTSNKPNIMFVGREPVTRIVDGKSTTDMIPRQPPTHIQNGMDKINLPSRETQLDGPFYHKQADTIVNLFPTLYKHVK